MYVCMFFSLKIFLTSEVTFFKPDMLFGSFRGKKSEVEVKRWLKLVTYSLENVRTFPRHTHHFVLVSHVHANVHMDVPVHARSSK